MRDLDSFIDWIRELDIQTLTDELKDEIIEKVEELTDEYKAEGYSEAVDTMSDFLKYSM